MRKAIYLTALLRIEKTDPNTLVKPQPHDQNTSLPRAMSISPAEINPMTPISDAKKAAQQAEEKTIQPTADTVSMLKNTVDAAIRKYKSDAQLSYNIKRVRPEETTDTSSSIAGNGTPFSVLLYLEGDQDAPQNFATLTVSDAQKLFSKVVEDLLSHGLHSQIESIEENPDAVDELADEEDRQK